MSEIEQALRDCVAALEEQRDDPDHFSMSADDAIIRGRRALALAEQPAQPSNSLTDDPLQGAVDWLLQADGEYFCTATVQRTLRIGYNRAKRLCDTAKERAAHGITGEQA